MDRIAIISDIHGNMPALEAVLQDIKSREIKDIICLGDIAGKGPSAVEAVDKIREICSIVIKGNWDYFISESANTEIALWNKEKLGEERIEYFKSLPIYTEFFISGKLIRLCHADPNDLLHRVYSFSPEEERLKLFNTPGGSTEQCQVVGYGDIHGAYISNFCGKTLFNVGSVGNPLEMTQASYGILEGELNSKEKSSLSICLARVPYDIEKAVKQAKDSGMPEMEAYVKELRTAKYRGISSNN